VGWEGKNPKGKRGRQGELALQKGGGGGRRGKRKIMDGYSGRGWYLSGGVLRGGVVSKKHT